MRTYEYVSASVYMHAAVPLYRYVRTDALTRIWLRMRGADWQTDGQIDGQTNLTTKWQKGKCSFL